MPAANAEVNEKDEDREEVEHALGKNGAEGVREADRRGAGKQRRARYGAGADRQDGREHEADRVREEGRVEARRWPRVEDYPPPHRAEDECREVHQKAYEKPKTVRRFDHPPDVGEVAFPEEIREEEESDERDTHDLENAFQGTRSLAVMRGGMD